MKITVKWTEPLRCLEETPVTNTRIATTNVVFCTLGSKNTGNTDQNHVNTKVSKIRKLCKQGAHGLYTCFRGKTKNSTQIDESQFKRPKPSRVCVHVNNENTLFCRVKRPCRKVHPEPGPDCYRPGQVGGCTFEMHKKRHVLQCFGRSSMHTSRSKKDV